MNFTISPIPPMVSILVGEAIYNLRAALDYLVFEIALRDSTQSQAGTQFPIEDSPQGFANRHDPNRRKGVFLRGVSQDHIAMIQQLQPFDGCVWSRTLRELSNPDKHARLTPTSAPTVLAISPGSTDRILAGESVDTRGDVSVQVTFNDGLPVVDTLQQLQVEVAKTLDTFKPCVEGRCPHSQRGIPDEDPTVTA